MNTIEDNTCRACQKWIDDCECNLPTLRPRYPSGGTKVVIADGSSVSGKKGVIWSVDGNGLCLVQLDLGYLWPILDPSELEICE